MIKAAVLTLCNLSFCPAWLLCLYAFDQLSERQRLFLYLIIQGHAAKECADYFDVSLGHWYNQRSELRSLCGLDEGESFEQLFDSPRESGA